MWPVTLVILVSFCGFMLSQLVAPSPWAMVLFYILALPYYLLALAAVVLEQTLGIRLGWAGVLGLAVVLDVVLVFPLRRLAARVMTATD
jgi:hypothetical protein